MAAVAATNTAVLAAVALPLGLLPGVASVSAEALTSFSDGRDVARITIDMATDADVRSRDLALVAGLAVLQGMVADHVRPELALTRGEDLLVRVDGPGIDVELLDERLAYVHAVEEATGVALALVYTQAEPPIPPDYDIWSAREYDGGVTARAVLEGLDAIRAIEDPTATRWDWYLGGVGLDELPPDAFVTLALAAADRVPLGVTDVHSLDLRVGASWFQGAATFDVWSGEDPQVPVEATRALAEVLATTTLATVYVSSSGSEVNGRATVGECTGPPGDESPFNLLVVAELVTVLDPTLVAPGHCSR